MQKNHRRLSGSRLFKIAALAVAGVSSSALAQISDVWVTGTIGSTNWSDPLNWVGGTPPDQGGTATFGASTSGNNLVTLDVSPTLSQINISSPTDYLFIDNGNGNSINLAATGGTINVTQSAGNYLFDTDFGHEFDVSIGGGALTKTGAGTIYLNPTSFSGNTYAGGTYINGGTIFASSDAALGATGAGNDIFLNGGTLGTGSDINTYRNITVGPAGGGLQPFGTMELNGNVGGTGTLTVPNAQNGTITFTGNNSLSGNYVVQGGLSIISGTGSLASVPTFDINGQLVLDNTGTQMSGRVGTTATIILRSGELDFNTAATVNESFGTLNLDNGTSYVSMVATGGVSVLQANAITRTDHGTLFVNGTSLGSTTSSTASQLAIVSNPGVIGGGGAAGTTTISIIPYASGNSNPNLSPSDPTTSFLTWDPATGYVRPLAANEYATSFSGATASTNVMMTTSAAIGSATAVNSLLISGYLGTTSAATGITISGTNTLTVSSGAILATGGTYVNSGGTLTYVPATISANIAFPAGVEGVIQQATDLNLSGTISGTGGLTISSPGGGGLMVMSGGALSSTYSGVTTISDGAVEVKGSVPSGSNSAFGNSTTAVVINTGWNSFPGIFLGAKNAIMSRNITVTGNGTFVMGDDQLNDATTWNGNISLANGAVLAPYNDGAMTINGTISGTGSLTDNYEYYLATTITLNASNTYSGGTDMVVSKWVVGNSSAFGTGTIWGDGYNDDVGDVYFATVAVTGTTPITLANHFQIGNGIDFAVSTGSTLTLTGSVDLTSGFNQWTGNIEQTTIALTGTMTIAGTIYNDNGTGFAKIGSGDLILTGTNTYTGPTVIAGGAIRGVYGVNVPTGLLSLQGGAFETSGTFSIGLGSTTGTVQLLSGTSGFSASTAPLLVSIGGVGTPTPLTWGSANFTMSALALNATSAGSTITFANDLNLGSTATQVDGISVGANTATMTGTITGSGVLTKVGAGTLVLTNPSSAFTGGIAVSTGTLSLAATAPKFPNNISIGSSATYNPSLVYGSNFTLAAGQVLSFAPNSTLVEGTISSTGSPATAGTVVASGTSTTSRGTTTVTAATVSNFITGSTVVDTLIAANLSNTSNNYTGPTVVSGILRGYVSASSNLQLDASSYFETSGTYTATLGTGAGQVQLDTTSTAGFSAATALTVNLGGKATPATISWGTPTDTPLFSPTTLYLNDSSTSATNALTFSNPLSLNFAVSGTPTNLGVTVGYGTVTFAGGVSGASPVFTFSAASGSSLLLTNTNSLTGTVALAGTGTIKLTGTASFAGTPEVTDGPSTTVDFTGLAGGTYAVPAYQTFAYTSSTTAGSNGKVLGTVGGTGTVLIGTAGTGAFTISNAITGSVSVVVTPASGAPTNTLSGSLSYTGNTTVNGGKLVFPSPLLTSSSLTVAAGATVSFTGAALTNAHLGAALLPTVTSAGDIVFPVTNRATSEASVITVGSLNLSSGSVFDVGNNDMILTGTSLATVDSDIASKLLIASGATNALTGLAAISNSNGAGGALYSTFDGISVPASAVLVKFTWIGDTNEDGVVNGSDLTNLLAGLSGGLTGYENGDLNYDGVVNTTDLNLLLASLAGQTGSFGDSTGPAGAVPEPTSLALAALAVPMLGRRRRM